LKVPQGTAIGERIIIEGYNNSKTEVAQLNPKKKVWENIQKELKTNASGEVLWKELNMLTLKEEKITTTLQNCNVK
jgi:tyrosyl-tRNA synthetase